MILWLSEVYMKYNFSVLLFSKIRIPFITQPAPSIASHKMLSQVINTTQLLRWYVVLQGEAVWNQQHTYFSEAETNCRKSINFNRKEIKALLQR
jgi:hypothetical protein